MDKTAYTILDEQRRLYEKQLLDLNDIIDKEKRTMYEKEHLAVFQHMIDILLQE